MTSAQLTSSAAPHAAPAMRFPERGVAALRIVVGLWFVKSIMTKIGFVLIGGVIPFLGANGRWIGTMPKLIAKYASDNPLDGYRHFLLDTVIPNGPLFAHLTALGELAVGVGLTLGAFTVLASAVGLCLVTSYGLSNFWQGPSQQGFHLLLFTCMVLFIAVRAGRRWGFDGWVRRRHPGSLLARLPLG